MVLNILFIFLALLALSFLIFIHEFGHYWMARRVGMRVETFSIGFGKPIISWKRNGVTWQIGWLFFGGYVKIAGQEADENLNPYDIPDGFFGKSPWARIKVAFAGPFMNLLLAIILFTLLWTFGGREKNYSEFTKKIGWVDPQSELYAEGIRPGDEVLAYGDQKFQSSKDHLVQPMTASGSLNITLNKVDYLNDKKNQEQLDVKVYPHPASLENGLMTSGIMQPANYLIYGQSSEKNQPTLPKGSPMVGSGIQPGDRIVWVDGEIIFSLQQLNNLINDNKALVTIEREGQVILRRVPRVEIKELRLESAYREELVDWQYEADLNTIKTRDIFTIPYDITNDLVVENTMGFIDKEKGLEAFPKTLFSEINEPLIPGDRIIAVNGERIQRAYQLIKLLQKRRVNIIVERQVRSSPLVSWTEIDDIFDKDVNWKDLSKISNNLGTNHPTIQAGNLYLLKTVTPKRLIDLQFSEETQAMQAAVLAEQKKMVDEIQDPEKKAYALNLLEHQQNQLVLGIPAIHDRAVTYNPNPIEMFTNIILEIKHTLSALLTGTLNPKWMSGPVGIIHMVHDQSFVSIKESFFWIGMISLNLGILNLLPIPVLDGGTIVFSLFEMITRRRIHPKTMEKLIIPFALLLICFFIFLTYNDMTRLFSSFF